MFASSAACRPPINSVAGGRLQVISTCGSAGEAHFFVLGVAFVCVCVCVCQALIRSTSTTGIPSPRRLQYRLPS